MTAYVRLLLCRSSRTALFSVLLMAVSISSSRAALMFWTGSGNTGNWDNVFNWASQTAPQNGDTLLFPSFPARLVITNNIAGLTLNQIIFGGPAAGYDIHGNAFTLTNGIEATNASGLNIIENNITLASADQVIDVTVSSLETLGVLSGGVGVVKNGAGTLIYFGNFNSYTGTTTVNAGILQLDCFQLNGAFGGPLVINSGTVQDIEDEEIPFGEPITINASGTLDLNNLDDQAGAALTLNGNGSAINGNPFILNSTATVTCNPGFLQSCTISGSLEVGNISCAFNVSSALLHGSLLVPANVTGSGAINKNGTGTLSVSGTNSFSGLTTINAGVVLLSSPAFNGGISGNVIVNSTGVLRLGANNQIADFADVLVNGGGLFDFGTFNDSIDTLHGTGSVTFGPNGYLTVGVNNGSSTFDGVMSGSGFTNGYTVGKFGTGSFTMTGNNTYLFGSDVFGGKLFINGSQPQSPIRIMSSGTTLGGFGVIGDIVSAGGVVSPGPVAGGPAILTASNVVFAASGNFTVEVTGPSAGTDYDQLNVLGTINLGNASLTVIPGFTSPPSIGQQFTIINNQGGGPVVGTFNGLPDNAIIGAGGFFFRINYNALGGNDVVLTLVGPVPGNTVTLTSASRGWYDSTGFHDPANDVNYVCGGNLSTSTFFRNWFVFDAPISGRSIIGAELIVNCYYSASPQGAQTYLVRGVITPIDTLVAGGTGLTNIYLDLGSSNAVYSERNIETNEAGQFLVIPLNVKFINDITAAAGGQIALGGSIVPTPLTNAYVFGFSGVSTASDVRLRLTYGNSVTLNAVNTGWYIDTGGHTAGNSNYFAGTTLTDNYRDFFVYNLPVISGPLVSAQLLVNCYTVINPTGSNPYQLYDVTTPIASLTNNAVGATGTFDDVGSGTLYGGRDIFVSETGLQAGIPLDGQFVSAVYANSGGQIALGGVDTSTNNGGVFASSGFSATDAQLWLGFLSAPATTPAFMNSSNVGNGVLQFTLSGTSGTSNEIQGSVDFTNWDYMSDVFMTNTTSVFTYTNSYPTPPTSYQYRFFRAKILP